MFLINGPLWIITADVLTDLSTVDNVVDPFNNWVAHEFTEAFTLYFPCATNFIRIICYEL